MVMESDSGVGPTCSPLVFVFDYHSPNSTQSTIRFDTKNNNNKNKNHTNNNKNKRNNNKTKTSTTT